MQLSPSIRAHNLATLNTTSFDVLVIGGGVTGAGVALDAAARGYTVALVEKADFASGTSSKSTKLIHGGIRYLPSFDVALVREGLLERGLLLRNAPFLVHPLEFVLPIYEGERHPVGLPITLPGGIGLNFILNMGLSFYDLLAGRRNIKKHRHIKAEEVLKLAPTLHHKGLKTGFTYYDAQTNDARLTMTLISTAAQYGATIANYTEVTSFIIEQGKVCGARLRNRLVHGDPNQSQEQETIVRARHIVNATGVFAEQIEVLTGAEPQVQIEPSKGVHLVLSRQQLQLGNAAIVLPETEDRRILFIVPWESRAVFGTTDTGSGDLDHPTATPEDIAYLLDYLNRYLAVHITEADIISTYVGYRPLVLPRTSKHSTAQLSRTHVVLQSPSGLVSIVGGKLTAYRRMAQDTVDVLSKRDGKKSHHPTQYLLLYGSTSWATVQQNLESKGKALGLSADTIAQLGRCYGSEALALLELIEGDPSLATLLIADLPYIRAQVVYACRQEMAMTPYDVLARRTSITLEDRQRGLGIVDDVAALMAQEHHWSPEQQQAMVDTYRTSIEQQLAAEKGSALPSNAPKTPKRA